MTSTLLPRIDTDAMAGRVAALLDALFPICRSISGQGVRESLRVLSEHIPLGLIELPTGTRVFDWEIPEEWNIADAFIADETGRRLVDFRASNLHVVSYSTPIDTVMTLDELRPHLHTIPNAPDAIPYVTSYYRRDWGFCLSHNQLETLLPGRYRVRIDSSLAPGSLTLAEAVLPGETSEEILLSSYCCHPSLANNELSGPVVVAMLYSHLASLPTRRFTYRFYLGPETIGALAYLSLRGELLKERLHAGLVVTCCGDAGQFTYKQVRDAANPLDRIVRHVLEHSGAPFSIVPFFPSGSDERQYCSPGFNLPIGSLMRSMYGTYPEYHTSMDDLDFISVPALLDTIGMYAAVLDALERNARYENLKPFGEPHLTKYGLYPTLGAARDRDRASQLIRYVLNFSDGAHDLLDIAESVPCALWELEQPVRSLQGAGLLRRLSSADRAP